MSPTVPRIERQAGTRPIPETRLPQAPEGAFGGALQAPQSAAIKLYEEELARLNQAVTLESDLLLDKSKSEILLAIQEKFKGKDAAEAYNWGMAEWGKRAAEIESGLNGDAQKQSVYNRRLIHGASLDTAIKQYAAAESERYLVETNNAWLGNKANSLSGAYADAEVFNLGAMEIKAVLKDFYKGKPAVAEEAYQKIMDKVHADGIASLLANDQDLLAAKYYAERKGGISTETKTRIEKALEEGSLRGEGQRFVDSVILKGLSLTDALKEARAIKDPKVRDEAGTRVRQYFSDIKTAEKLELEDAYTNAVNLMEQNPGKKPREVVPPSDWVRFSIDQRKALENRKENLANDDKAWVDFIAMPSEQIAKLSRAEFETGYWSKFDDSHRGRAETLWLSARESAKREGEKADKFTTIITPARMTEATWGALGLGKTTDNPAAFAQFEQEVQRQVNLYEATVLGGKRKAGSEEIQKIINDIAVKNIMIEVDRWGWFTGTKQVPVGEAAKGTEIEGVEFKAPKVLDTSTAMKYLKQAGGDKNKAREMARKDGYSF